MKKVILLILLLPMLASAQYFEVFDIDTSEYPIMKAKFYSIDANGKQILNHTPADFEITENGEPRDVISVSCPPQNDVPFSVVIAIDVSGSMIGENIEHTKTAIKTFIDLLPNNGSELAIIAFNHENYFINDFTTNKSKLKSKVDNLKIGGGTDFNAAFLNPLAGSLLTIEKAKYQKRSVVLITDGYASGNESEIINNANNSNTNIFSIIIGTKVPNILMNISKATGGRIYSDFITINDYLETMYKILNANLNHACLIHWESEIVCSDSKIAFESKWQNNSSINSFIIPKEKLSKIVVQPSFVKFGNNNPEGSYDTTITLSAINADFEIQSIRPKYGDSTEISFINVSLPFLLRKGDSKVLTIRFTPKDSSLKYVYFDINSNNCATSVSFAGGFISKDKDKALIITHPNGGELFAVTMDTIITWEGIAPSDTVSIDFSIDEGLTWKNITNQGTNLSYTWENIPPPASTKCLIRVRQGEYLDEIDENGNSALKQLWEKVYSNGDSYNFGSSLIKCSDGSSVLVATTYTKERGADIWVIKFNPRDGSLIWQKTYGGSSSESASSIIEISDGNFVLAGMTRSKDGDITNSKGSDDIWVIKINSLDGSMIWQKTYGGSSSESASSILESSDGNLIVAGATRSFNGDVTKNKGNFDIWLLKISPNDGKIIWQETYGGNDFESANSIIKTSNGDLVVAGITRSIDGQVLENKGFNDIWVLKISSLDGSLIWQKTYGGSNDEYASSIIENSAGNYVIIGYTNSSDGDISYYYGKDDIWIFRINSSDGSLLWDKSYGENLIDRASSIIQNNDGNLLILGSTQQSNGDFRDVLLKIDPFLGEIITKIYFNRISNSNSKQVIIESEFGQYIVLTIYRENHIWLLKYSEALIIQSDTSDAVFSIIMPEPVIQNNDIDMGQMIVGSTKDTIVSSVICNIGDAPLHVLGVDITGGDAGDFLIPRGAGDFYLAKDSCQDMMFEFTPSALGNRTAVATIRTTIGDFRDTIQIRGVGIDPIIEATAEVVDFGVFELGEGKDTTVVLVKNVGTSDINITDTQLSGPDTEQFSLNTAPISYTISAGEEKEFQLNYTAKYGGKTNSFLDLHYDGIGSPIRSLLFAEGIGGEVYPQVADAYVGETVNMEIYLGKIKPEGLSEIATNFTATVSYNSTLLAPIDKSIQVTTEDNKSYINIDGELSGMNQIAAVPMKVGLGTAVKSGLVITEFQLYDANGDSVDYDIEPGVGEFNVLGICEEGGVRLINPNGQAVDMVLTTDGLNSNARINLTLIETGQTDLVIFDQIGNMIETVYSGTPSAGQQEINLDLSKYTNGRYYIKLTTPTITKTEIIEVVR